MSSHSLLRRHFTQVILLTLAVGLCSAGPARAALTVVPAGLDPGDQFRVAFVTSTMRNGTSSIISDYDQFVTSRAMAAGIDTYFGTAITWQAIASTPAVGINPAISAISRLPVTSPAIYRIDGVKVADSGTDLWDGTIDNPLNVTELGSSIPTGIGESTWVWTGTNSNGSGGGSFALGAGTTVIFGTANSTNLFWVNNDGTTWSNQYRIYGYSSVLTVPAGTSGSVPEPSSLLIMAGLSILGLAGNRLRRRSRA